MNTYSSDVRKKLLVFFLVFLVAALSFGWLYKVGVNRPPLKYAHIPDITKEYIRNLGLHNGDQGVSIVDRGPFNWDNEDDAGEREWLKEIDRNFVVYYHRDHEALWQARAQDILKEANRNIDPLIELLGHYHFPESMNGRRLAIYLPENEATYKRILSELLEEECGPGVDSALGITVTQIGPLGCLTKGIVINPIVFDDAPNGINGYIKTLAHEMCHYEFFSSIDYSRNVSHYMWVSEGIAEYFCDASDHHDVTDPERINVIANDCRLTGEFPRTDNTAYWAGESFFRHVERTQRRDGVKKFLQQSYIHSTDSVFIVTRRKPSVVHQEWVKALKNRAAARAAAPAEVPADAVPAPAPDAVPQNLPNQ